MTYVDPEPDKPESLGLRLFLWGYPFEDPCAFVPIVGHVTVAFVVVVPSSWRLVPDPGRGVALRNVWSEQITAEEVWRRALAGEDDFRVVPAKDAGDPAE